MATFLKGSGLHAFVRYIRSYNLHVGSIRYDGVVTIKRQLKGDYKTLEESRLNSQLREYFDVNGKLTIGNNLELYLMTIF